MKLFRLVINGQKTHIQEYKKEMLFGPEWETLISLSVAGTGVNKSLTF